MSDDMPSIHPAADIYPMMSDAEISELADDIRQHGQKQPCLMIGDAILDGRNRWRACLLVGLTPMRKQWKGKDPIADVISLNEKRRHLSAVQKAAAAVKTEALYAATPGRPRGSKNRGGNHPNKPRDEDKRSLAQSAKKTGASLDSAKKLKQAAKRAPEVLELVQNGQIKTVAEAGRIAAVQPAKRAAVVSLVRSGVAADQAVFSVSGAIKKSREQALAQRDQPIHVLARAVASVQHKSAAVRGACERLEDLCTRLEVTTIQSPDFMRAGMALLQARTDISRAIKILRINKEMAS